MTDPYAGQSYYRSESVKQAREYFSLCGYTKFERPEEHFHFKALVELLDRVKLQARDELLSK